MKHTYNRTESIGDPRRIDGHNLNQQQQQNSKKNFEPSLDANQVDIFELDSSDTLWTSEREWSAV